MKMLLWLAIIGFLAPAVAAEVAEQDVKEALALYREFGLPEPDADAKFILLESRGVSIVNGVRQDADHYAAYRLKKPGADGSPLYVIGAWLYSDVYGNAEVKDAKESELKPETLNRFSWLNVFDLNNLLATGLHLWSRGYKEIGLKVVQRATVLSEGHHFSNFYQPGNDKPQDAVVHLAWAYWGNLLTEKKSNRKAIYTNMKAAYEKYKDLQSDWNKNFLDMLAKSASATPPVSGTLDALVTDLAECRLQSTRGGREELDPYFDAALCKGFEIVPTLIKYLDDNRLTRSVMTGFNNFPSYIRPLSALVSDLLQQIACDELGIDWLERQKAYGVTKDAAETWWKATKDLKEDEYLAGHLFPSEGNWPNSGALRIIEVKFPSRLEVAFIELIEKHDTIIGWPMINAVANSSLSKEKKTELMLRATKGKSKEHRDQALRKLAELDEPKFVEILLKLLEAAPKKAPASMWSAPEAMLPHLVVLTANEKVWEAFLRAAKRAEVPLRLEYMNPFNYTYLKDKQRNWRLRFLAAFLEDTEVFDVEHSGQDGPHAAFVFKKISVQNFAASEIADILNIEDSGDPEWTDEQWKGLREQVAVALKKEGIQAMKVSDK